MLETHGQLRNSLIDYVRRSLKLDSDDADEILWGSPRSLLLEVLPTLARRLQTNWQLHPSLSGKISEDIKSEDIRIPSPTSCPRTFSAISICPRLQWCCHQPWNGPEKKSNPCASPTLSVGWFRAG